MYIQEVILQGLFTLLRIDVISKKSNPRRSSIYFFVRIFNPTSSGSVLFLLSQESNLKRILLINCISP